MRDVSKIVDNIVQTRAGGEVQRCHAIPHHGEYSNATHSWGVAMLMHQIWPGDFARLGLVCLSHDVPEFLVGDMLATVKRHLPSLKSEVEPIEAKICDSLDLPAETDLNTEDYVKVKACDMLEFYLWCRGQINRGNQYAQEGLIEITDYLDSATIPAPFPAVWELLQVTHTLPRQAGVIEEVARGDE